MNRIWKRLLLCGALALQLALPCFAQTPTEVIPGGEAIGLSVKTDGVYITGFSTEQPSPAQDAGLQIGDRIVRVGDILVENAQQLGAQAAASNGAPLILTVARGGSEQRYTVTPRVQGGVWKLGLLVKDEIAGIGTLTYYDPQAGRFGALGHAVSDQASKPVQMQTGTLLGVTVVDLSRGERGKPGALLGVYDEAEPLGILDRNVPQGVFGTLFAPPEEEAMPVASAAEVEKGPAVIRCTVDDAGAKEYDVEITAVRPADKALRNLQLRVTDPVLLERTGGIVQGVSGAPILQNGKLVGAVTHVLVDQPDRGYGILIENMLAADQALKQAA